MIVTLEGNIGAGKTSFLGKLECIYSSIVDHIELKGYHRCNMTNGELACLTNVPSLNIIDEPIDEDLLEGYYNGYISAFELETYFINERRKKIDQAWNVAEELIKENDNVITITERGLESQLLFSKVMYDRGSLSEKELDTLRAMDKFDHNFKKEILVYFSEDNSEELITRIVKRNRPGENNISYGLIDDLDKVIKSWVIKKISEKSYEAIYICSDYTKFNYEAFIADLIMINKKLY